ncbi:hypothetical protein GCU56_11380 [Geodermatophilus sabuli]|uniref:DUF1579 domain-containing protein n=1 Tax=Geodermatophilus sabuli TaxID=1564158 RepID=A0A7K3W0U5_9ACTN|nr:hypothetical protein [Geodermatophilus sabuli]NEK58475.1 hypothetical protein [Geodermatophilus sabuli]
MRTPGADGFDLVFGRWQVHDRQLRDDTDPVCEEWVEFDATSEAFPVLHGLGHVDRITVPDPPEGPAFEGMTLRPFDPSTSTWSIHWSSTRTPGRLDPPVVGRFTDRLGVFEGEDVLAGRPVRLRFEWRVDADRPSWHQSFSWDGGGTWRENWTMTLSRAG